jgi:Fic family protein
MSEITDILSTIQRFPYGISLNELLSQHPDVSRRTMQRWIKALLTQGELEAVGQGRARRYSLTKSLLADTNVSTEDVYPGYIPISADSSDIVTYIDQPLSARHPIGYQRDFLESYIPNKTFYLSSVLRRQLHRMGDAHQEKFPAGTFGREMLNRLLVDLSWASSHMEGNTYSLLDTQELIEHGKAAVGKSSMETQMILNHKFAIELLINNADLICFNKFTMLNLHSILSENLLPNPADEGRIRQHMVQIGKSVFQPLSVPAQLDELFDLILNKADQIEDPFEQSFFIMVHLPYLQPFADVNKRTSRLAANLPLIKANLCPLTFIGVPEQAYSRAILGVYEMTRVELLRDLYVWAYERSTQEYLVVKQDLVEPDPQRLFYREIIKKTVASVVLNYQQDAIEIINQSLKNQVKQIDQDSVQSLIIEELRRLHEGVLARYGLRRTDFKKWKERQK